MMKLSASIKSEDAKDVVKLFLNTGPQLGQLPVRDLYPSATEVAHDGVGR
jgi:hypothetical protein